MDTLLKPRHLSETESDDSVNFHSLADLKQFSNEERCKSVPRDQEEEIVCPTARYLRVNSKKISSYDLLVRPPKQPRLLSPSSSSTLQKSINDEPVEEEIISDSVRFESETINHPRNKDSSTGKATILPGALYFGEGQRESTGLKYERNRNKAFEDFNNNKERPRDAFQLLYQVSHHIPTRTGGTAQRFFNQSPQSSCKPSNGSFQTIFGVINEKDENKNYLPNDKLNSSTLQNVQPTCPPEAVQSIQPSSQINSSRIYKKPLYRLPAVETRTKPTVYLKESDYISGVDPEHEEEDRSTKRMKLNGDDDIWEEIDDISVGGAKSDDKVTFLFKICNEVTNESAILSSEGETPILSEEFSSHTNPTVGDSFIKASTMTPVVEDDSQVPLLTSTVIDPTLKHSGEVDVSLEGSNINEIDEDQFATSFMNFSFHNPFLQGPNANFLGNGIFSGSDEAGSVNMDDEKETMSQDSLFAMFLQDFVKGCNSGSGIMFDTGSFLTSQESQCRVEDVTEEYIDTVEEDSKPASTILQLKYPTIMRNDSTSCQLVQGLFDGNDENCMDQHQDAIKDLASEDREFLMQPNTYLRYSNSLHSGVEERGMKSSTTDKIMEKTAKSDYFVGKLTGLSRSLLKIYRKFARTPSKDQDNAIEIELKASKTQKGNISAGHKVQTPSSKKEEAQDVNRNNIEITGESHVNDKTSHSSIRDAISTCYRKLSSRNRVSTCSSIKITNAFQPARSQKNYDAPLQGKTSTPSESKKPRQSQNSPPTLRLNQKRHIKGRNLKNAANAQLLRSSSSSSIPIKTFYLKGSSDKKMREELDSNSNIVKRLTKLFKKPTKKSKRRTEIPVPPSYKLPQHTDSVELYRDKRYKFFQEVKEFQDDSLKAYFKVLMGGKTQKSFFGNKEGTLSVNDSTQESSSSSQPSPINLPFSDAIPILQSLRVTEMTESNDVLIPARVSISESAIPTTRNRPLGHNLLVQCPPVIHMLALTAQSQRTTGYTKGILKKNSGNKN